MSTRRAVALLRSAAAPERRLLRGAGVGLVLAALLESAAPLLGKHYIDAYLLPRQGGVADMALLLALMLAVGWGASLLRYLQLTRLAGVAMRSVRRLRERVFAHVLSLPIAFFDRAITGQLVSRVTNDTEQVKQLYVQVLFVMLDSTIVVVAAFAAMLWLDWRLAAVVAVLVPTVIAIVWCYQRWSGPAVARARQLRSEINARMAEAIGGMAVLQASNAERLFAARFAATSEAHYQARRAELRINAWLLRPMLDLVNVALLAFVIWRFGQRPLDALEIGVLYAFVGYIGRVVEPLIQITLQFGQIQQAVVAAARVDALLAETPAGSAEARSALPGKGAGAIALRHVAFGYQAENPVLHDLSLTVPAGAFYGIVGHTGSGKTTLLSLLLRFYTPQSGAIEIDGLPLAHIGEAEFRRHIGLVPQEPFLLAASVAENIAMGRSLSDAEIAAAAEAAHCAGFIARLPQGYATLLGEGGARLSTGQKQLIAIARALAGQPRILFLDEATAHVDSATEQIVQRALLALRGRVTIVAIAHRLSTIRSADRIVVMNHGRIAEQGTHEELLALPEGIYQRLHWLQQIEEAAAA